MKDEFKSYILEEIPALKKYNGKLSFSCKCVLFVG